MKILKNFTVLSVVVLSSIFRSPAAKSESIEVNLRDYVYQTPEGMMLCSSGGDNACVKSFAADDGELVTYYSTGQTDWMARSETAPYYIGDVRTFDRTSGGTSDTDHLTCFGNPDGTGCVAPPNGQYPPSSAAQIFNVNVASVQDVTNATNPNGSPKQAIAGNISFTNYQQVDFGVYSMNPDTCAQNYIGNIGHQVLATFVRQFDFGGDLNQRDALIIDEYETGPTLDQYHMERYYYVNGFGRVRDGSSFYNPATQVFDNPNLPSVNSFRNYIRPAAFGQPPLLCPQGSAPLQ